MNRYLSRALTLVVGYCLFLTACSQSAVADVPYNVNMVEWNVGAPTVWHDTKRGVTCYAHNEGISCIADQWLTPQGQQ
ncbi:hypothetical protein [Dyella telluris]|uniref:Uncharacterized protein n=1 Tax=Dyella telluris TaxID=2763498 RepID=A0A7G8Q4L7_9GAMM|nr:hypothetical protein [Dyella telluris]QNK01725.1 hypothetical protein H8F01_00650 [Dyella telluris]